MSTASIHTFDAAGEAELNTKHLMAEVGRLQRENERLRKLLTFRLRCADTRGGKVPSLVKH